MYYCIKGQLEYLEPAFAVVDCGGVGYKLFISAATYSKLAPQLNKTALLYSYLSVKEDSLDLYGFYDENEKTVFVNLLSVSGVGPKAAMSILSTLTVDSLAIALASGDAKAISSSPGIGLKTAQKIIIELKDKLAKELSVTDTGGEVFSSASISGSAVISDAVNALAGLGYSRAQAMKALEGADQSQPLEIIIREALKKLYS